MRVFVSIYRGGYIVCPTKFGGEMVALARSDVLREAVFFAWRIWGDGIDVYVVSENRLRVLDELDTFCAKHNMGYVALKGDLPRPPHGDAFNTEVMRTDTSWKIGNIEQITGYVTVFTDASGSDSIAGYCPEFGVGFSLYHGGGLDIGFLECAAAVYGVFMCVMCGAENVLVGYDNKVVPSYLDGARTFNNIKGCAVVRKLLNKMKNCGVKIKHRHVQAHSNNWGNDVADAMTHIRDFPVGQISDFCISKHIRKVYVRD